MSFLGRSLTFGRVVLLAGAALPAVSAAGAASALDIVATTGMVADAVERIGGDAVSVRALMGPGIDPHTYRQTSSDIAAMAAADAVFWHGLYLEAQLEDFLFELGQFSTVVAVAEQLPADQLIAHPDYPGRYDPHVWMDPELWQGVVVAVRDALVELMPEGRVALEANAEAYLEELGELAEYGLEVMAGVPEAARVLVTAHDAFGYFGRAYDFEVLGIQGISTESEAGLNHIEALVNLLVERDIGAIFVESSVSDRNVRALIEGAAARGHAVVIGGELFSDAMGAPGTYEGTYIGMIDHNVTTIARALGGSADGAGLHGLLAGD